jgi:predicted acylesterase/phospholipase RssA
MTTGSLCSFHHGGFTTFQTEDTVTTSAPNISIAFAVTASSAFPPLFPPVLVDNDVLGCDQREFPYAQYLTDGGVYDNLGLDHFARLEHQSGATVDHILVSDAEGNVDWTLTKAYTSLIPRNIRASDLLMKRVSTLLYNIATPGRSLIRAHINHVISQDSEPTALPDDAQRMLRNVRTDLDVFTSTEINCLVKHGFTVGWHALQQASLIETKERFTYTWEPVAHSVTQTGRLLADTLKTSRIRKNRLWCWTDWVSWISALVIVMLATPIWLPYLRLEVARRQYRQVVAISAKRNTVAVDYYSGLMHGNVMC